MALIRIPTGVHTVTATIERRALLYYRCPRCGREAFTGYRFSVGGAANYHVFGGGAAEESARSKAGQKAVHATEQLDAQNAQRINRERDFDGIREPVVCRACGQIQPWSVIPSRWRKKRLFVLWVIGVVVFVEMLGMVISFGSAALPSLIMLGALLTYFPVRNAILRKKALARMEELHAEPPVYYGASNFNELVESPARSLAEEYLANEAAYSQRDAEASKLAKKQRKRDRNFMG